jgi:N-acetylglucosaminyl-diphospho-decaprenol L-rhamnosyltransferase
MGERVFRSIKMKVYVVIVTYNPLRWIEKCFNSLRQSTCPLNTIVIDNNSIDGSSQRIQSEYPEVDFISSEVNLGFGAANNIGIKKAYDQGADFVFLLNQDAWIEPDTIEKLTVVSKNNPEYGILSPMHYNGLGNGLDYNFSTFIAPEKCKGLLSDIAVGNPLKEVYELPFVNAAGWLLTRSCIETVGGFNPSFFHYAEDLNYGERVIYHQLKIGIVPDLKLFHDRQKREKSIYIEDQQKVYKRRLIRELSRPILKKSKSYFYLLEIKNLLKSMVHLDTNNFKSGLTNFNLLINQNFKEIKTNREQSLKKGLTFLNQIN